MNNQFKTKPRTYRIATLPVHEDHPFRENDLLEVSGNYLYVLRLASKNELVVGERAR